MSVEDEFSESVCGGAPETFGLVDDVFWSVEEALELVEEELPEPVSP